MKANDPTSTVRESEFALGQNAGSLPQKYIGHLKRAINGQRLSDSVRQGLVDSIEAMYTGAIKQNAQLKKQYIEIAKRNNIDPRDIIVNTGIAK